MNKKPVSYLQTDPRWKNIPYRVKGESSTIGGSGCGPTSAAMLIETLTGKTYTPADACAWSLAHGFKALNQGTYYGYFKPQFAEFGIQCDQLNWTNTYGKPGHPNHDKVLNLLKDGYYIIACMGPGTWTRSGHFVVMWWQDNKVRINDPASTKEIRLNGDIDSFRSQVKYYWWIDARKHNAHQEEEEIMTQAEFNKMADAYFEAKKSAQPDEWSKVERAWAEESGLVQGDEQGRKLYKSYLTREEFVVVLHRFFKLLKTLLP